MNPEQAAAYRQFFSSLPSLVTAEDLFGILGQLQDELGCIPRAAIRDLAGRAGVSETRLFGAVTSYPDFLLAED
ncbi:MAG: hypothetical protein GXP31_19335 [Kiritimatiellaeota bacterium]|nr:hypothetical protein [Kiritimatiellota bacterium]